MSKPRLYDVTFIPRGQRKAQTVRVGFRSAELLVALGERPLSRMEMLRVGRPRIGLNAPGTVSTLMFKGFNFEKHRVEGEDERGNVTWWLEYELLDRIVSIDPVRPLREVMA